MDLTNPFIGLQPYSRKDYGKLFGRDGDMALINARIFSARTTLLFAPSGVGKTSFLNAKLIREFSKNYVVIYFNNWPIFEVKNNLKSAIINQSGDKLSESIKKKLEDLENGTLYDIFDICNPSRFFLILDQFEEIFQYNIYQDYYNGFIDELSAVINNINLPIRVLFSMREEFLGELSIFDNRVPDLFNNYYRLHYPDIETAKEIITKTVEFAFKQDEENKDIIDEEALKNFVEKDLSRLTIETESSKNIESSERKSQTISRSFILPPYLQIVCQRLWGEEIAEAESKKRDFQFLRRYKENDSARILKTYCEEKFSSFKGKERIIAAKIFDYLISSSGIKIAYELNSLSRHLKIDIQELEPVLETLSKKEIQILRKTERAGTPWYELYHDMFGPIISDYKNKILIKYIRATKIKYIVLTGLVTLIITLAAVFGINWFKQSLQSPYRKRLAYDISFFQNPINSPNDRFLKLTTLIEEAKSGENQAKLCLTRLIVNENDSLRSLQPKYQPRAISGMAFVPEGNCLLSGFKSTPIDTFLHAYYIDIYPVSNLEFCKFLNDSGNKEQEGILWYYEDEGKIKFRNDRYIVEEGFEKNPVVGVSFFGAKAYAQSNYKRLPTEHEWEKAMRGVNGRFFTWGYLFNKNKINIEDIRLQPAEEDKSPFNCYNIAGNISEWTDTFFQPDQEQIVIRGGSCRSKFLKSDFTEEDFRLDWRAGLSKKSWGYNLGFRCAKNAKQ